MMAKRTERLFKCCHADIGISYVLTSASASDVNL
jgi:hypothetical protein